MANRIKVLHIISDSNFGGAGRLLLNLSQCIDKDRFDFIFAVPKNSVLIKKLKQEGSVFTFSGGKDKSFDPAAIPSILGIIRVVEPDIVHTHSSISGRIASKLYIKKTHATVYTKHCVFEISPLRKYNICRKVYRLVDNILADKIIAVADVAKIELVSKGVSPSKITVIINGSLPLKLYSNDKKLITKQRLGINENDFVVGIVARLENYKGHKTLLDAAEISKREGEKIKFIIVGDGSCKDEYIKYANKLGISDRVIFTGFTDNVSEYMNIFDLNINCSTGTETSCLAISEGASIGIPAIVSSFGGNPNMVINGLTGYIYPQGNANELYKIINKLKNAPQILDIMKENIKKDYNDRFSSERMAKEYERFYIGLM